MRFRCAHDPLARLGPLDAEDFLQPAALGDPIHALDQVLAHNDRDALVWFSLLLLRNVESLAPMYRVLPAAGVALGVAAYVALIRASVLFPALTSGG